MSHVKGRVTCSSSAHFCKCNCLFGTKVSFNSAVFIMARKYSILLFSRSIELDSVESVLAVFTFSFCFPFRFPSSCASVATVRLANTSSRSFSKTRIFSLISLLNSIFSMIFSITFAGIFACWMQNLAIFSTSFAKNMVGPSVSEYASFVVTYTEHSSVTFIGVSTFAIFASACPSISTNDIRVFAVCTTAPGPMLDTRRIRLPLVSTLVFGISRRSRKPRKFMHAAPQVPVNIRFKAKR